MRLGATLAYLSEGPPIATARWAERLVSADFESLWVPNIIGRGYLAPDPFVTLAVAATATATDAGGVEIGTATVQVPLYHPVDLAHRVLSLRSVCGERLTLGVSPGSTATDYAALDRDYAARFRNFHADVDRLRRLLADGHDERADVAPAAVAAGGPQLLLGSWGANVERAARDFDGWLASGYRSSPDEIVAAHERYRAAGGRRAMVCAIPVDAHTDLDRVAATLRRYADAGFDDAVVTIGPNGPGPEDVRALLAPSSRRRTGSDSATAGRTQRRDA